MARKREKRADNNTNWMDTYGDMITLVLCFFVMLVSSMDTNQQKWEILVQSLNPDAMEVSQIVDQQAEHPGEYAVPGGVDMPEITEDITQTLYYTLQKYIEQNNLSSQVNIGMGDGYEFITFDSTVFFAPNSYDILPTGKQVLDGFANILQPIAEDIDEVRILGHTSQASADAAYDLHNDRFLASNRADAVLLYLQDKNIIDPAKLVSVGYGQYRPIAGFDTAEGRSKNRRVEMIIKTAKPGEESAIDEYYSTREAKQPGEEMASQGAEESNQTNAAE